MTIQVVCPGCKKRFSVSDKFAGKKGPCPQCKVEITIPEPTGEVKIHEPESFGPKGKGGRASLKPIFREEAKFSPVVAGVIGVPLILTLVLAIVFGSTIENGTAAMNVVLALGSLFIAPPLAFAGYIIFRDNDLEPFRGKPLLVRMAVCSVLFAGTWGLLAIINVLGMQGDGFSMPVMMVLLAGMILVGGGVSYGCFNVEYLTGAMHYGMYLVTTILLRWIVVGAALPLTQETFRT